MAMTGKNRSVEQIIQQAMREGKFDDLKGKGEPIKLNTNPHADPEWQLAYDMLSSEGFVLPWMDKRNEIERRFAAAVESLQRTWLWYQEELEKESFSKDLVEQEWQTAVRVFSESCDSINELIVSYNLEIPRDKFFRMKIGVDKVIEGMKGQETEIRD